ncbi:MAG: glutamate synthase subunit beta, partial [Actinobacteria bacterium]|nr:glutamate synthase subunit beta [Actinomycetota bacterium]
PDERKLDHKHYYSLQPEEQLSDQGARCMDCGVPFCHVGCPLGNLIPDWNNQVYRNDWYEANDQLHATNNFPEFTGRICPAPCESACVLAINDDAVTIQQIELGIVEHAFNEGWVKTNAPTKRSGKRVAVVGSGPAGLAAADELNKRGHLVTVFERDEAVGGLMRFGVPDAKLEKWVIDRRVDLLEEAGIEFRVNADVGGDITVEELREQFDAVLLATGSRVQRAVDVPGGELAGVYPAMDYLYARNRAVARAEGREGAPADPGAEELSAAGKHVIVIGGGDTGMDCLSNAGREGAKSAIMLDVYQELPESGRTTDTPWPLSPRRTKSTYALDEGGERRWGTRVTHLTGENGRVTTVHGVEVQGTSSADSQAISGTEFSLPADLVMVAIGFTHPEHEGLIEQIGVDLDGRGNIKAGAYVTSQEGVFAAGDARTGQSLIVSAIAEGRRCARVIEAHLTGNPQPLPLGTEIDGVPGETISPPPRTRR